MGFMGFTVGLRSFWSLDTDLHSESVVTGLLYPAFQWIPAQWELQDSDGGFFGAGSRVRVQRGTWPSNPTQGLKGKWSPYHPDATSGMHPKYISRGACDLSEIREVSWVIFPQCPCRYVLRLTTRFQSLCVDRISLIQSVQQSAEVYIIDSVMTYEGTEAQRQEGTEVARGWARVGVLVRDPSHSRLFPIKQLSPSSWGPVLTRKEVASASVFPGSGSNG